jgi:hypothetical protein
MWEKPQEMVKKPTDGKEERGKQISKIKTQGC